VENARATATAVRQKAQGHGALTTLINLNRAREIDLNSGESPTLSEFKQTGRAPAWGALNESASSSLARRRSVCVTCTYAEKPEQIYLIVGDIILGDELVSGADDVIATDSRGAFDPGLKLQPCRADAPDIEYDLKRAAGLLRAVDGAGQDRDIDVVGL
jgi:hypothetical protein